MSSKSTNYGYLNNQYYLLNCGDINGGEMYGQEVLTRYPNYKNYLYLFDKEQCYMNYQCEGTSYDDFRCTGSIKIVNKNGDILLQNDAFDCWTTAGLYYGKIVFTNNDDKEQIGNIYVFSPYWCRIQLEYDVKGDGEKTLLTFEFWKGKFNDLPAFLEDNQE